MGVRPHLLVIVMVLVINCSSSYLLAQYILVVSVYMKNVSLTELRGRRCAWTVHPPDHYRRLLHVVGSTWYQPAGRGSASDWSSHGRAAGLLSGQPPLSNGSH